MSASGPEVAQEFGGNLNITGRAQVSIEIEAKVWIFRGKAGASGSVHTSWTSAMRMNQGKREKMYEFEGVVLSYSVHGSVSVGTSSNGVSQQAISFEGALSGSIQAKDVPQAIRDAINDSSTQATNMAQQRVNNPPSSGGDSLTIFAPEKTDWEAYQKFSSSEY